MSWFFGKKKHKESPPDSPGDPPSDDAFIFVEKRNQADPDSDNKTPSLYPSLSNITPYPPMAGYVLPKQASLDGHNNDLSNIPFKFCKELELTRSDDLVIDKLRLEEILSFIKRVDSDSYEYGFNLERSVINELNSQNEE